MIESLPAPIFVTGLDSLLYPNQTLFDLDLDLFSPIASILPISTFDTSGQEIEQTFPGSSREVQMIMTGNAVISDPSSDPTDTGSYLQQATVTVDTMLVGDPVAAASRVLDLSGLSWSPDMFSRRSEAAISSAANQPGFVTISNDATLYLRDLVLFNLQAAVQTGPNSSITDASQQLPPPEAGHASSAYSDALGSLVGDMGNFTSLLWFFNFDRDLNSSSGLGRLVLDNVTLVIPDVELRSILRLLNGGLNNVTDSARGRMAGQLAFMQAAALQVWVKAKLNECC